MLVLAIDNGSGPIDYSQAVVAQSMQITDGINVPTLTTFKLANLDNTFVVPKQSAYAQLYSTQHQSLLASGFVTNEPERAYLGRSPKVSGFGFQQMEYTVQVTSDEWLLNVKAVPFIPAFVNQTMGQILAQLAETLAPGFFDTSTVQDGDLVPYFLYDPTQKWSDLAKQFADSAQFRYKVLGKQIVFAPVGDAPLGISYDDTKPDRTFVPDALHTNVLTVPPVNNAIVIGDIEPQNMHEDYFIGDGFTANYPLRHTMFNGSTNLLLQDDWTEGSFSSSWVVQDPTDMFLLAGGLNAIGASGGPLGQTYVQAANGLELGGHLALQHGLFTFTDVNTGLIGGVFNAQPLAQANCIAAFQPFVASGDTLAPSPSGANNLSLQGVILGQVATPVLLKTKVNHQYLLTTRIDAQRYTRYNQIYRTVNNTVLGNQYLPALATVTFSISDYDQTFPWNPPTVTAFTVTGQNLPSFGVYSLLTPTVANLSVAFTLLSQPPQGLLSVQNLFAPSGSQLPILPSQLTAPATYPLGFGMQLTTATVTRTSGDTDTLSFYTGFVPYTNDIPGAGARIHFTSWEAGKAVAQVADPIAIAAQAVTAGDDGIRTAIFPDLKPLPRTSQEADWAAVAQIADRSSTQYDGSYTVYQYFWDSAQDFPWSGRFLPVHSPQRNILHQVFFVRQVTTTVVEMFQEILTFEVSFGQDLFLEKLLRRFIATPQNILESQDAAQQPMLQHINTVGTTFLDDLVNAQLTQVTGASVTVDLGLPGGFSGVVEVRRADWGWGISQQNLVGKFTTNTFTLARGSYEQVWYLRQVIGTATSRFTKVLRVVYPLIPAAPALSQVDETDPTHPIVEMSFTGDIRNIRGIEIRDFDNTTVLQRTTTISNADLNFTYNNQFGFTTIVLYAYFFNLMWEYSTPLVVTFNIGNPIVGVEQAGPNLVANPGFEAQSVAYAPALATGTGQFVADAWVALSNSQYVLQDEVAGNARTGQKNGLIRLSTAVSVAASGTVSGGLFTPFPLDPTKEYPARGGDYYYFGGYAGWYALAALPAGVVGAVKFQLQFYDSNKNFISAANSTALTAENNAYTFLDGATAVPTNAAFMQFSCLASVTAANSGSFSTGATLYQDARFDDVFVFKAVRGSHGSYRPLSNPLAAVDAGGSATINIASFTMRCGNTDIVVSSGVVTTLTNGIIYFVYYDDSAFVGGAVTYNAATIREVALQGESRFFVGSILTPGSGAGPTIGFGDGGSGAQYSKNVRITPTTVGTVGIWTNPTAAIDNDLSTFAQGTASGSTAAILVASGGASLPSWFSFNQLNVVNQVTASGNVLIETTTDAGNSFQVLRNVTAVDPAPVTSSLVVAPNIFTGNVGVRVTVGSPLAQSVGTAMTGVDSGVNPPGFSTYYGWTNAAGAAGGGGGPAVVENTVSSTIAGSSFLKLTNFGFGLLASATVVGVAAVAQVASNGLYVGTNQRRLHQYSIKLYKAGVLSGTDHFFYSSLPTFQAPIMWGGTSDLWGLSLLYSDVNDVGFGIGLAFSLENTGNASTPAIVNVASVTLTVYFTIGSVSVGSVVQVYDISQNLIF